MAIGNVTVQKMEHVPLSGTGLSIPEANKRRLFAKWVERKEVRQTPVTDWMKRRSDPYDNPVIETGQSYAPFITTTLTVAAPTTGAADETSTLTFANTAYLRDGDVLKLTPLYSGSTTEYNYAGAEYATIIDVLVAPPAAGPYTAKVLRHQGESSSGSFAAHPIGTQVKVISRAVNYNDPFGDAITYKGDIISQAVQRFDSGEITYDLAAVRTPDYESDNHMLKDILVQKDILPKYREAAFIEGRRVFPDYNQVEGAQIPGQLGGMIWWSEQGVGNVYAVDGQINAFTFDDILRDKAENHSDGPGDTMFGGYRTIAALDTAINELKGDFGPNETTFTSKVTKLSYRWGDITPRPVHGWPEGKILITSKGDWEWGNYVDMDWQYVERGPEELGAFQKSWTMGGDFSMTCLNITRQILLTGIDTRLNLYPGRQIFMSGAVQ